MHASSSEFIRVQNHDDGDGMFLWNIVRRLNHLIRLYARGFFEFCLQVSERSVREFIVIIIIIIIIKLGLFLSLLRNNILYAVGCVNWLSTGLTDSIWLPVGNGSSLLCNRTPVWPRDTPSRNGWTRSQW
jgi:hypothetical protein